MCSRLSRCIEVTDLVGGAERLGHSVTNSGDSGGNTGDELSANTKLSLGDDAGDGVSNGLLSDDAGDDVERVGGLSGQRASQAGSSGDSEGLALLDSGGLDVGISAGAADAVVDVLATTDPLPRVASDGSTKAVAVVKSDIVANTKSAGVVEVDDFSAVLLAVHVAEDENRAWLRASDFAVACTLDGG